MNLRDTQNRRSSIRTAVNTAILLLPPLAFVGPLATVSADDGTIVKEVPKVVPSDSAKEGYIAKTKLQLQESLTPIQFNVTQNESTEPPFTNKYWNNTAKGVY